MSSKMIHMHVFDDLLANIRKTIQQDEGKVPLKTLKDFEQIVKHLRELASIYQKFIATEPEKTYAIYEMAATAAITAQAAILTQDSGEIKEVVLEACNHYMAQKVKERFGIDLVKHGKDTDNNEASNGKGLDILAEEGLL